MNFGCQTKNVEFTNLRKNCNEIEMIQETERKFLVALN